MVDRNYVFTPGIHLLRRSVVDEVGGFDPVMSPADDWDYAARVSRLGPIGTLPEVVLNWRRHDDTMSNTSTEHRRAYFDVRRKMLQDPGNTPEQVRLARRAFRDSTRGGTSAAISSIGRRDYREAARTAARALDAKRRYIEAIAFGGKAG